MFTKSNTKTSGLQEAIDALVLELSREHPGSERYTTILTQIDTLRKLKALETSEPVSNNTLALIGGNILVTGMILWHERANVITTKALSFLTKMK